jgi:hypothetical protein
MMIRKTVYAKLETTSRMPTAPQSFALAEARLTFEFRFGQKFENRGAGVWCKREMQNASGPLAQPTQYFFRQNGHLFLVESESAAQELIHCTQATRRRLRCYGVSNK